MFKTIAKILIHTFIETLLSMILAVTVMVTAGKIVEALEKREEKKRLKNAETPQTD